MESPTEAAAPRIKINLSYIEYKEDFYPEANKVDIPESEKKRAKSMKDEAGSSLEDVLNNQKINLYYVEENDDGSYDVKTIYENPSHDLISIILPLQKGLYHLGEEFGSTD